MADEDDEPRFLRERRPDDGKRSTRARVATGVLFGRRVADRLYPPPDAQGAGVDDAPKMETHEADGPTPAQVILYAAVRSWLFFAALPLVSVGGMYVIMRLADPRSVDNFPVLTPHAVYVYGMASAVSGLFVAGFTMLIALVVSALLRAAGDLPVLQALKWGLFTAWIVVGVIGVWLGLVGFLANLVDLLAVMMFGGV